MYDPVHSKEMGCDRKYILCTMGHSALNNGSLWQTAAVRSNYTWSAWKKPSIWFCDTLTGSHFNCYSLLCLSISRLLWNTEVSTIYGLLDDVITSHNICDDINHPCSCQVAYISFWLQRCTIKHKTLIQFSSTVVSHITQAVNAICSSFQILKKNQYAVSCSHLMVSQFSKILWQNIM